MMHNKIQLVQVCVYICVTTYFVSLSMAWTCTLVWVLANTASCCAHFRHSPATRGAPPALSVSVACFSFFLRDTFTSSHSF